MPSFRCLAWWKMASELNGLSLILRWAWDEARSVKWIREWSISEKFVGWTTVVWSFPLTGESTISSNRFWLSMDLNPDPDNLLRRRFGRSMGLLLPSSSSPEVPSDSTFVISETWDDDSVTGPVISFPSIILQSTDCISNCTLPILKTEIPTLIYPVAPNSTSWEVFLLWNRIPSKRGFHLFMARQMWWNWYIWISDAPHVLTYRVSHVQQYQVKKLWKVNLLILHQNVQLKILMKKWDDQQVEEELFWITFLKALNLWWCMDGPPLVARWVIY